ncbi:hypothetical protein T09_6029, partial [Trichinella sp. T9]
LYYKNEPQVQMLLESETFPGISCFISFSVIPTKIATSRNFLTISHQISIYKSCDQQYLGKYAFINRATSFWKVPRQTNAYVSNKWPLKLPCAYLNTQGSSPSETPLIPIDDRKFFDIIMKYLLKLPSVVQYFAVLSMSIFLHFRSISNKLKKVVSIRVEMLSTTRGVPLQKCNRFFLIVISFNPN